MDFAEVLEKRRSIRKFDPRPVAQEDVDAILEAGRRAPSGGNLQPWRYVVIESAEMRARLREASPRSFFAEAPLIILACYDIDAVQKLSERAAELKTVGIFDGVSVDGAQANELREKRALDTVEKASYAVYNTAISLTHMDLTAVSRGLGTCWVGMFDKEKMRAILELPDRYGIVCALLVGHPLQSPPLRPRVALDDIVLKRC